MGMSLCGVDMQASVPRHEPSLAKRGCHREKGGAPPSKALQARDTLGSGQAVGQGNRAPTLACAHHCTHLLYASKGSEIALLLLQPLNSCCAQNPESPPTPQQTGNPALST